MRHDEVTGTFRLDDYITTTTVYASSSIDELKEEMRQLAEQFERLQARYEFDHQPNDTSEYIAPRCNAQLPDFSIEDIL